jgi:hypothetical protein
VVTVVLASDRVAHKPKHKTPNTIALSIFNQPRQLREIEQTSR